MASGEEWKAPPEGLGKYVRRTAKASVRETGTLAFVLHRVTGLLLTVYLFLHIGAMSLARLQGQGFEELMATFRQPAFLIIDWFIVVGVLIHALNGVRLVLFDLGIGLRHQRALFWGLMAVSGVVALIGLLLVLPEILGGA
ncbi:MAG: succinate dehydrogenase, cytochrome b556 subunit [Thermoplasmata archaeon]